MTESELCVLLAQQIQADGLPEPVLEERFHPVRKWRFDFAWPEQRLAVEVEGGVWISGRHTRGSGFTKDCEKYNTAALDGWTVLRVTSDQINSGQAMSWIRRALVPVQE